MADTVRIDAGRRLKPGWGRLVVLPSPVDEEHRTSGLIVPLAVTDTDPVSRGVVVADSPTHRGLYVVESEFSRVGTVVYFPTSLAVPVLDALIVNESDVLAYEDDDA